MKVPSFFRTPSHRVFDLTPRYYDPEKERRGDPSAEETPGTKAEQSKARIRYHFSNQKKKIDPVSARKSLFRVILIAAIMGLFIIWMFAW